MRTRRFGSLELPVIGLGTWQMERDDRASAIAAIRRAIELGLTHVDTAEMYGNGRVETMVGEAIAGHRDQIFLTTKVLPSNASYAGTKKACEASLRRMRTDRVDLYLLHWRGSHPLADTFRAFDELVAEGKVRAWGVSNFDDADLAEAIAIARPACNQVLYHLDERSIEHRVIPWCEEHDVAVVAYSPFGSGRFREAKLAPIAQRLGATPRQIALAYLTRRSSVFAIPKSSQPAHVDELAHEVALDADAIAAIEAAFPIGKWRGLPTL
jgi:diketogulonate reductase-like aldo/keto reductase